jgi:biopolymer transport protein ExbD
MARLRKKEKDDAEIDVGAFADIAFLLIIFFILTTSIMRPTGREVAIPQAQTPQNKQVDDKTPSVNVLPDKLLFGQDEASMKDISMDGLRVELSKLNLLNAADNDRMIVLEVGDDVDYDRYYKVVTLISEAGGIVALVEDDSKGEGN